MDPNIKGRPKSRKIVKEAVEERPDEFDEDLPPPLPSLKSLMKGKKTINGFEKTRKVEVITSGARVPIHRRSRIENSLGSNRGAIKKKNKLLDRVRGRKKSQEIKVTVSLADLNSIVFDDEKNSNLPQDFNYDLRMYNSPNSKPDKTNGELRMIAHPCYSESLQLEENYRLGNRCRAVVPKEHNEKVDRLSRDLEHMLGGREKYIASEEPPPIPPPRENTTNVLAPTPGKIRALPTTPPPAVSSSQREVPNLPTRP